ncbi:MAG: RES family NAD+ phosphorylase [Gammaproteobacteria bacterium]|jgi:hypothetical protein
MIGLTTHRLIPTRFPTISFFDWAESAEELEQLAELEGLTNDRLKNEQGDIYLIHRDDWVLGPGATPLMAAFTHPGVSRFTDGSYGVYYAGDSLASAIAETIFHRERFLRASNEMSCLIQMREYIATIVQPLETLSLEKHAELLDPDPAQYFISQTFAKNLRGKNTWGLYYPSVRKPDSHCVAIFRPKAMSIPTQGCHLDYIWDGEKIAQVRQSSAISIIN